MGEGLNKVMLIGNLGQNPELRYTQSGQAVLSLRMATNERYKNRDGEWQDKTEWHTIVVWGKRAEGLRYQARVGEELARRGLDHAAGPWLRFEDRNGVGYAQPDFVVITENEWLVLEAKLTQTSAAFAQLFRLYIPLLSCLHPDSEFAGIQVCRNLRTRDGVVDDLRFARNGATWHWLS